MNPAILLWLMRLLWKPKSTPEVVGLERSIAARVLGVLDPIDDHTAPELADEIRADARAVFRECLEQRGVPQGVYRLLIDDEASAHRVERQADGCSWSLREFDEFIDLGLHVKGS